jgi:hypothetical protein
MTHPEDEKEPDPQTPPEESESERHDEKPDEHDDLSPEAREIEQDPSLNPDNDILRDIKGG